MPSTMGIFTFLGACLEEEFHVLMTEGAAPTDFGSIPVLDHARDQSTRPYEADDFAANFVARAYPRQAVYGGTVKLLPSGDWSDVAPPETRFRYAISPGKARHAGQILVMVYAVEPESPDRRDWRQTKLTQGTLDEVVAWAEAQRVPGASLGQVTRVRTRSTPIGAPHVRR